MSVQRRVIILPVPFPQGHSHVKANNSFHFCLRTGRQDRSDIFLCVVEKRQNRRQPDDRRNSPFPHLFQHLNPPLRIAYVRFKDSAQPLVPGRQRDLDNASGSLVNLFQQVDIPQDPVRFRLDCRAESVFADDFQALPCQAEFFFAVHIGIGHRTGTDHRLPPFGFQRLLQQFRCILLNFNILKSMGKLITPAAAVTVNAPVGTSPVNIHPVTAFPAGQDPFCAHKMHLFFSLLYYYRSFSVSRVVYGSRITDHASISFGSVHCALAGLVEGRQSASCPVCGRISFSYICQDVFPLQQIILIGQ